MHQDRIRVLIADDNKDFVTMLSTRLSLYPDMEIAGVARDGVETLRQIERLSPDVLLLDIVMPELNGLDVLEKLRDSGKDRPAVFVLSAIGSEQIVRQALALGAAFYFIKPCSTEDMIGKVRAVIAETGGAPAN